MNKTFVNIDEAFNHGVLQGAKGAIEDVQRVMKDHPEFLEKYLEIKLKHFEMTENFFKNAGSGVKG